MQKPVVCIFCLNLTLRCRLTNQLENQYRLFYPSTIQDLLELLRKIEVACVIAHPIQNGICRLWQLREIKENFDLIPIIIAGPCTHMDFIRTCADSLADECVDFNEIDMIHERIQSAMDRRNFREQLVSSGQHSPGYPPRVKKALQIIHFRFTKIKFAKEVSGQLGISVTTFRKEFKQFCGATFTQYLIRLKLLYATYLAQNDGLTAKTIALRCGFSDEHEFYRCFKKKVGTPFSEYRANHTFLEFSQFYNSAHQITN